MFKVNDRFEIIRKICANKKCLDIGCVGDLEHHLVRKDKWLFMHLQEVCEDVLGIDINSENVDRVNKLGIKNIIHGDAETYNFHGKFDVIVAGELIEHLVNPGMFLNNIKKNLNNNGLLILTTPNIFSINNILRSLLSLKVNMHSDHAAGFNFDLLRALVERCGFRVESHYYFTEKNPGIKNLIFRVLTRVRPKWGEGILVIAKPI